MSKFVKEENSNAEIFEHNNKIGIRRKNKNGWQVLVEPIYDYDKAIMGSYYVDPDYHDGYYLYRFRDGYTIFKLGNKVCVFDENGYLVEELTSDIDRIIEKYYYGALNYWKNHSL